MLRLESNKEQFWQWDSNQRLIVDSDTITEVHYCNKSSDCSLITYTYEENGVRYSNVPNILLQNDWRIHAYAVDEDNTRYEAIFKVCPRSKPADYIYTETEVATWSEFENRIDKELTDMKAMISSVPKLDIEIVEQLPTENIKDYTIYLVKSVEMDNNLYTEYLYINGEWELLGSTEAGELDLTNYVKKTDIATTTNPGLTYATGQHGIFLSGSGQLRIAPAEEKQIDGKPANPYAPITPKNLDYAVKSGITKNTITLTDDEKAKAKEWLGISDNAATATYAETAGTANTATNATYAETAGNASTATNATNADSAKTANKATTADTAGAITDANGRKATVPNLEADAILVIQNDLTNYYKKNETYNKDEVDAKVSAIPKFAIEVVNTLPTTGISPTTIYLLVNNQGESNLYKEYIYVNNAWEMLGEQKVDLTGYATETFVSTGYQPKGNYALKSDIPTVPVQSVNGKTGAVSISFSDVGAQPVGDYATRAEIPEARNMDYIGETQGAIKITDGSTVPQVMTTTGIITATKGSVATQSGETFIFDGSKWNSIKVKMPTTETLTITGIDENGNRHTWNVWGVAND